MVQISKRLKHLMPGSTFLVCLLLASGWCAAVELHDYPGAEMVSSHTDTEVTTRRIILGSLEKINNILEPESVEFVTGSRQSATYYIANEKRVAKVIEFYRDQLSKSSRILFRCHGRDCGSSNYWANTIFQTAILYGPEQDQNYLIGRANSGNEYIAIYVGQRGTRKIYVHIETTLTSGESPTMDEVTISAALLSIGRYVIPLPAQEAELDSIARVVAQSLKRNRGIKLTLVTHDSLRGGETLDQGRQRTLGISEKVKSALVSEGIEESRLSTYGLGPLSPLDNGVSNRLELLIIN